jgi:hypothetical protein
LAVRKQSPCRLVCKKRVLLLLKAPKNPHASRKQRAVY